MKNIIIFILVIVAINLNAQQMPAFANTYANRLIYNPAQAYTEDSRLDVMALSRNQWAGLDGAPSIQFIQAQFGLPQNNVGVGAHFLVDQAGPFKVSRFNMNFSYKLAMDETQYLVLGVASSISHNRLGLSDLALLELGDELFQNDVASGTNLNFGFGAHFKTNKWSFDIALPKLLKNRLFTAQELGEDNNSRDFTHFFMAARYEYQLTDALVIKPSVAVRMIAEAPASIDLSANVVFREKFEIAPFVRISESIGVQATYFITNQLYAGYSYETGTSPLRRFNSGSHEFFVGFRQPIDIQKKEKKGKDKKEE